jgi:hypothetical protein
MTRREAAQILGVRERASEERVKDAHRRIMIANHPDSGEFRVVGWGEKCVCVCVRACGLDLLQETVEYRAPVD